MRIVVDMIFSIVALLGISYGFITNQLSLSQFLIAIMINYVGARYLLVSDLDLLLTELELQAALEQEEENK